MKRIARFEKISLEQWLTDANRLLNYDKDELVRIYDNISLPVRATKASAGYDFKAPFNIELRPNETIMIPTGVRVKMDEDYALFIFPRSGLGFKYRLQLNNTVGVIDSDYYFADNEGHIMCRMTNDTNENKTVEIKCGNGFAQGIFLMYGITEDDVADGIRIGGFGSTTRE